MARRGQYGIECIIERAAKRIGYWKTLARLRALPASQWDVSLTDDALQFHQYPFQPSSAYPNQSVRAEQVVEVNPGSPCELRLADGDVVFVPTTRKETLLSFVNQRDVSVKRRRSVWSALLDPFLDTWEEQATIDAQFAWLDSLGLPREAVDRWREEVAEAMVAYNFGTGLWEWVSLSLFDVLTAQRARLSANDFEAFYRRAIPIAQLDPVVEMAPLNICSDIDAAVDAVLREWVPRAADGSRDESALAERRAQLSAELAAAYSQSHRHYHGVAHIEHCLRELSRVWDCPVRLNEVRWAVLFHDSIYDPIRHDNELRSAEWAGQVMNELHRPADECERVRSMILATAHAAAARTPDEALLLDIDLSIFAGDAETFDAYDAGVRAEYAWVPEDAYRTARKNILRGFLDRPRIYQTSVCRSLYETSARINLERALARLERPTSQA